MKVLYMRVSDSAHAWVAAVAAQSGLSMGAVMGLIIEEARRRDWQIEVSSPRVTAAKSPAASAPAPLPRDQGQAPKPPPGA